MQQSPVIVKLVEAPYDPTGIADALIGALGLTGFITALALLCGALLAGVLAWRRSRHGID